MLSRVQRRNALLAIRTAAEYGHHHDYGFHQARQNCQMMLMIAMTEASLHNVASANVPESKKHQTPGNYLSWTSDGLGHDHASMNMFQQQTGYARTPANGGAPRNPATMEQSTMSSPDGWGTPDDLMQIPHATRLVLDALREHWFRGHPASTFIPDVWTLGERCQLVQGSAFPDRYQSQAAWADNFMRYTFRFRRAWRATKPKKKGSK